jgi:hypothetical protein
MAAPRSNETRENARAFKLAYRKSPKTTQTKPGGAAFNRPVPGGVARLFGRFALLGGSSKNQSKLNNGLVHQIKV